MLLIVLFSLIRQYSYVINLPLSNNNQAVKRFDRRGKRKIMLTHVSVCFEILIVFLLKLLFSLSANVSSMHL